MKSGLAEEIDRTVGTGRGRVMAPVVAWLTYQRSRVFSQNICAGFLPGASPRISTWVPVSRGVCPYCRLLSGLGMPFLDCLVPTPAGLLGAWKSTQTEPDATARGPAPILHISPRPNSRVNGRRPHCPPRSAAKI